MSVILNKLVFLLGFSVSPITLVLIVIIVDFNHAPLFQLRLRLCRHKFDHSSNCVLQIVIRRFDCQLKSCQPFQFVQIVGIHRGPDLGDTAATLAIASEQ